MAVAMKMAAVILYVKDMQGQVEFYRDRIGLKLAFPANAKDYSGQFWVEFDTGACMLALHKGGQGRIGEDAPKVSSEVYETPIEHLDLSVRVFNSLKRTGITTVGEVMDMLAKGEDTMLAIRNFGDKSLDELRDKLREKGYLKDGEAAKPETAAVVENPS